MTFLCIGASFRGRVPTAELAPALDAIVDNPWEHFTEQAPRQVGPPVWARYDRAAALALLERDRVSLLFRSGDPAGAVEGRLWNNLSIDTSAIVYVPTARTSPDDPRTRTHLSRVLATFPPGSIGTAFIDSSYGTFHAEALPPPLDNVPWLVALPAAADRMPFDHGQLLRMPALRASRSPDGIVWLQLYQDPFSPTQNEVDAAVSALEQAFRR